MKRLFILAPIALLLLGCPAKQQQQVLCMSLPKHPPAFWIKLADEVAKIEATSPNIVTILDEHEGFLEGVKRCIDSQKKRAKKK